MLALTRSFIILAVLGVVAAVFAGMARAQEGCLEQIAPEQRAKLQEQRISLNLRDASIPTTLRLLAQQYRLNMVVTDDVTGSITLDFFQVPARDIFEAIIDAARLDCVTVGGALRVSTSKRLKAEQGEREKGEAEQRKLASEEHRRAADLQRAQAEARQKEIEEDNKRAELEARGPVREETIRLRYADAEEIAKTIQGILGLPPQGTTPVPLSQLSQLYVPSPPLEIPSTPPPPQTVPVPVASPPPDVLAKGLTVQAYKPTNSVFIRYYARDIERIKKLIQESLDIAVPQIQIAAQMVITTLNALEQIGIQWGGGVIGRSPVGGGTALVTQGFAQGPVRTGTGTPSSSGNFSNNPGFTASQLLPVDPATGLPVGGNIVNLPTSLLPTLAGATPAGGLLLGLIGSNFNINLAIQALEVQGKARTLAEPKAVTVENAKAVISRGFEVPYTSSPTQGVSQVQFKDALLKLEVTPRLIKEDGETKIRMKVNFENNEPDFARASITNGNPPIFKRKQETEVLIREGQRLVIGGVTNDTSNSTIRQVPLLGGIPVLGWLFKSRETNSTGEEMIVILTPSVVSEPGKPPKR